MPHLTADLPETRLAGNERALVTALTEAIVGVYGEWARPLVSVRLFGVPAGRFAQGCGRGHQRFGHVGRPVRCVRTR